MQATITTPPTKNIKHALLQKRLQGKIFKKTEPQPLPHHDPNRPVLLSLEQQRLWFLEQFEGGDPTYNEPLHARLRGHLNVRFLERAVNEILRRHQSLRICFENVEGQPVMRIAPHLEIALPVADLRSLPPEERQREIERRRHENMFPCFDLSQCPLFRITLLQAGDDDYYLLLTLHHIIFDGWSIDIFRHELMTLYNAFYQGKPSPLPELTFQYADYTIWQRQMTRRDNLEKEMNYWRGKLAAPLPTLDLPADRPRPPQQTFRGAKFLHEIPNEIAVRIEALGKAEKCTLSTTLLAAFKILLFRYTGQEDVIVGSPAANRGRVELETLIGFFANTIVLRDDLSGNPTFRDLLRRVHRTALEAQAYQHVPFDTLVEELHPARDLSHTPFFQTMFVLQSFEIHDMRIGDILYQPLDAHTGTSKFDQTWELFRTPRGLLCSIEYNADIFDEATIRRMAGHYQTLLAGIAAQPGAHLSDYNILTDAERRQILMEWNQTEAAYPLDQCVHQLVEAQAERTPDAVALIFGEEQMTYRELNQRANQLAHYLRQCGVTPNMLVGIHVDRSFEMLIGLLGILKAGGAYLPLDPAFPTERLHFMADDAKISVLVTQTSLQATFSSEQPIQMICVDADWPKIAEYPETTPAVSSTTSGQLCYLLYTSGSTGKPKGVQITHRNFVNFLCAMQKQPGIDPSDVLLAVTTLSFDIAGLELFLPLISGARIVLAKKEDTYDGSRLLHYFQHAGITMMQATPVSWRLLIAAGWDGTPAVKALCGGEALPYDLKQQLLGKTSSLWNMYGPTETTVWSTLDRVLPTEDIITIGRPIANTQIYILDRCFQPVPVGMLGDLYIGGEGVSLGYFQRPELSQERFLANPFSEDHDARIYRTGDLARYRADGRIEFFGRSDFQIKIRGYRIELGEIETVLTKHPAILEAIVIARGDADNPQLAAYLVFAEQKAATEQELRDWLKQDVPDYMIPATFTFLPAMPLTPNGKVDRRALPEPERQAAPQEEMLAPPRTALERQIAEVWAEAFGMLFVGIHDNFFLLGGQSLLAMQVAAKLSAALRQPVNVRLLFQHPTIAKLAAALETLPAPEIADPPACCQAQPPERPVPAAQPEPAAELFAFEHRPLLSLIAAKKVARLDAVALDYITTSLLNMTGINKDVFFEQWCHELPTLYNIMQTNWGRIGLIMLPFVDSELFSKHDELINTIVDALEIAQFSGAQVVSLTGMLPAVTNNGLDITRIITERQNLPQITTGHSTICAVYILNVQKILQASSRNLSQEYVAFFDLNSLGYSILRLMLQCLPHPKKLLLCDLYDRRITLEQIQRQLIDEIGFQGQIQISAFTPDTVPQDVYDATLMINTFNLVSGFMDVNKIQSGTLLIEPTCFQEHALLQRFHEQQDILFTSGDILCTTDPVTEYIYRPQELRKFLTPEHLSAFGSKTTPYDIPGCVLSSLLASRFQEINVTVGTIDSTTAIHHYNCLQFLKCQGAQLHIGKNVLQESDVKYFRSRFGL